MGGRAHCLLHVGVQDCASIRYLCRKARVFRPQLGRLPFARSALGLAHASRRRAPPPRPTPPHRAPRRLYTPPRPTSPPRRRANALSKFNTYHGRASSSRLSSLSSLDGHVPGSLEQLSDEGRCHPSRRRHPLSCASPSLGPPFTSFRKDPHQAHHPRTTLFAASQRAPRPPAELSELRQAVAPSGHVPKLVERVLYLEEGSYRGHTGVF